MKYMVKKSLIPIFLSFSGSKSEYIADYFKTEILLKVFGAGFEYFTSRDIEKGMYGYQVIIEKCKIAGAGISFLTKENIDRPWINYEAGLINGSLTKYKKICTVLVGISKKEIKDSPLEHIQYTLLNEKGDIKKLLRDIYSSVYSTESEYINTINENVEKNWERWNRYFNEMPEDDVCLKDLEELGKKCKELGIHNVYHYSSSYIVEYKLTDIINRLKKDDEIFMFGKNLMYSSPFFDSKYKNALEKGLSLNFICHDPDKFSKFIQDIGDLNPADSLTSIELLKQLLIWIENKKPIGMINVKYYKGDLLDSAFIIREGKTNITHISWELSFGKKREENKRVILLDIEKQLGKDIKSRYLDKVYKFARTVVFYDGKKILVNKL